MQGSLLDGRGQTLLGGVHEGGVIGARNFERKGAFDADLFGGGLGGDELFGGTGEDDLATAVEVGHLPARSGGDFGREGFVYAEKRKHGALGLSAGFLHEEAALGHELKALDGGEGAGGGVGRKFAKGKTGGGGEGKVGFLCLQDGEEGEAVKVKGGLAIGGAREGFLGTGLEDGKKVGGQDVGAEFQNFSGGGGGWG